MAASRACSIDNAECVSPLTENFSGAEICAAVGAADNSYAIVGRGRSGMGARIGQVRASGNNSSHCVRVVGEDLSGTQHGTIDVGTAGDKHAAIRSGRCRRIGSPGRQCAHRSDGLIG